MSIRLLIEQIEADNSLAAGDFDYIKEVDDRARLAAKECRMQVYNEEDVKAFVMGMNAVTHKFDGLPPNPQIIVDSWLYGDEEGILFGKYLKKYGYDVNNKTHFRELMRIGAHLEALISDEYFPWRELEAAGLDDDAINTALSAFWCRFATTVMSKNVG